MERNIFLKTLLASGTLAIFNPLSIVNLLTPRKCVRLPFLDGMKDIYILESNNNMVNEVAAQYFQTPYGYQQGYNYGNLAPYQQWYSYQQAVAQWNAYYQQQQQYYAWLDQQYMQQMSYMLQVYGQSQQIGSPTIWPNVQSMYAFAKNPNSSSPPVFFGVNANGQNVAIQDTTKAAAKVWNEVSKYYSEDEAEVVTGPQSSEVDAVLQLPNNLQLGGKGYYTKNGAVAVSYDPVKSADGKIGQLAKYRTKDGENYLVI